MKVLLICGAMGDDERQQWHRELAAAVPEANWLDLREALQQRDEVRAAVVASPPPGSLAAFPALRLIQSLWAGVDRLLADASVPPQVPLARMVDPMMNAAMAETALWAVLGLHRRWFEYQRQQRQNRWLPLPQQRADEVPVLVLGRGQMGGAVAATLRAQGYPMAQWHRGLPLEPALHGARIVINLLPLTAQTRGLLDAGFFAAMPRGASLINLGRGAHVVDADLLDALDRGHVQHAVLDVFHTEPLPAEHAFWSHEQVTVLPHVAAWTDPRSAAAVVARNLRALARGEPLAHLVDRSRGY